MTALSGYLFNVIVVKKVTIAEIHDSQVLKLLNKKNSSRNI